MILDGNSDRNVVSWYQTYQSNTIKRFSELLLDEYSQVVRFSLPCIHRTHKVERTDRPNKMNSESMYSLHGLDDFVTSGVLL